MLASDARLARRATSVVYCSPFSLVGWLRLPLALVDRLRGRRAWRERTLLLVRHAATEPRQSEIPDRDRALTGVGRVDAERLGALLAQRALLPDLILASPALRAQQTAALLVSVGGFAATVTSVERLYPGDPADLRAVIAGVPASVRRLLLVGHDPGLSAVVARLSGGSEALPPGGVAVLSRVARGWAELAAESAQMQLVGLWRPAPDRETPRDVGTKPDSGGKWIAAGSDERVVDVARRAIDNRVAALGLALSSAVDHADADPDRLRRVRVAGRRMEAVIRAYRDLLPRKRRDTLVKDLRRIRRATRRARDDALLIPCLEPRETEPCVSTLLALLKSRRVDPRPALAEVLSRLTDGGPSAKAIAEIRAALARRAERPTGGLRFGDWARSRYEESVQRYASRESVEVSDAATLHELRLAGKKLRYEVELLAAVLPARVRDEVYPALVEMQDRLGVVSDQASALARLEALVGELDASHPRDDMLDVVATERARLEEARTAFVAWRRQK